MKEDGELGVSDDKESIFSTQVLSGGLGGGQDPLPDPPPALVKSTSFLRSGCSCS